ncbi:MAG: hypothetical protein NUV65_05070 [Candidatus Roizmanbacteria bacterium]|nr:hypothetical protein [Candidatus Roizmanbacteria bacterium]
MNKSFVQLLQNKFAWFGLFGLTYVISFFYLPQQVPLYYSTLLREDKLANKYELLLIPLFLIILFILWERIFIKLTLGNEYIQKLGQGFIVFLACMAYGSFVKIILSVI